jgi:hypothetical protein
MIAACGAPWVMTSSLYRQAWFDWLRRTMRGCAEQDEE